MADVMCFRHCCSHMPLVAMEKAAPQQALAPDAALRRQDRADFEGWLLLDGFPDRHGGAGEAQALGRPRLERDGAEYVFLSLWLPTLRSGRSLQSSVVQMPVARGVS